MQETAGNGKGSGLEPRSCADDPCGGHCEGCGEASKEFSGDLPREPVATAAASPMPCSDVSPEEAAKAGLRPVGTKFTHLILPRGQWNPGVYLVGMVTGYHWPARVNLAPLPPAEDVLILARITEDPEQVKKRQAFMGMLQAELDAYHQGEGRALALREGIDL